MQRLYTEKCSLIEKARRACYHLKNERRRKRMESIGLYIHIPFCRQKCLYCDFPSWAGREGQLLMYVDALTAEI